MAGQGPAGKLRPVRKTPSSDSRDRDDGGTHAVRRFGPRRAAGTDR